MKKNYALLLIIQAAFIFKGNAQACNAMNIQFKVDIGSVCSTMVITMAHDNLDRPFLYVANKEAGLKIYNISDLANPALVATLSKNALDTLDLMNLSQDGNYLYLALGNSFTNPQRASMAIVDISNPNTPIVKDIYRIAGSNSGAGIVKVEGNYAYFGAMKSGLYILDISDKSNIQFASKFSPSIAFPPVSNPNPDLYNARGMEVKNSIVYLCFDAGGIRIINCSNKAAPFESGRWCNPVMYTPLNHAKAYNNLILDDTLLYVAVDYCGMEVLNIADTGKIKLQGWWNPYHCPNNNWFSSAVHSNEIQYDKNCKRVLMSTGKSDMMVIDVSNPSAPDSCNNYGGISNNLGTWGIGLYKEQIYLSYICSVIPFSSNWTGVRILTHNPCNSAVQSTEKYRFSISPNPVENALTIKTNIQGETVEICIFDIYGKMIQNFNSVSENVSTIDCKDLSAGLYTLVYTSGSIRVSKKFLICR